MGAKPREKKPDPRITIQFLPEEIASLIAWVEGIHNGHVPQLPAPARWALQRMKAAWLAPVIEHVGKKV